MELSDSQIARLVLGYLKAEKCYSAFDVFFNTSPQFRNINNHKQRSKYVVTRVVGYSLKEILSDYSQIYNLIQERLEPTSYFEQNSSKNIVDQLLYLLNDSNNTRQNTPQRSRSSTPIKDTNKKSFFHHNLSIIEENISNELNTTPLEALPGNSQEFNNYKRRCGIKTNKNTVIRESDSGDSPDNHQEDVEDLEVLRQTFLEHTELHEKIAENINLVINTTDNNAKLTEEKVINELDSAIKAIVERTEADPMFEKFIGDLIGSTCENSEIDSGRRISESEKSPECSSNLQEIPKNDSESIKHRLRSPKKHVCEKLGENKNVGNSEVKVIQTEDLLSVNKNVQTNNNQNQMEKVVSDVHKNLTVNTNTGDIILYEGSLDNYVKTSTPSNANPTNPILLNNNLLMVQSGIIQPTAVAAPLMNTIQIEKPYYLLNNSQFINVSVPQYKLNNVTEQDILNMPTVIVCDDNNQQAVRNRSAKSSSSKETQKQHKILPKHNPESSLREYLSLYQCGDEKEVAASPIKSKSQQKEAPKTQAIHIEILKPPNEPPDQSHNLHEKQEVKVISNEKPSSPRPVTPEASKQNSRKATPKSGSHVRALDFNFNTPGHKTLNVKKAKNSSKSPRKNSPTKSSSTKISKSLFGSPSKNVKVENGEDKAELKKDDKIIAKSKVSKQKEMNSWDSDLRALMVPAKDNTPKRKRKESGKKSQRKSKLDLNATEVDAEAIEANLKEIETELHTEVQVKDEPIEEVPGKEECTKKCVKVEILEEDMHKAENEEFTVTLINCNVKPKFRKKCNIDNSISKSVKITKVKEIKSLELVPDGSNKLILSPSKLNANKRTLVENVDKEINLIVRESTDTVKASIEEVDSKLGMNNILVDVGDKQEVFECKAEIVVNESTEKTEGTLESERKDNNIDKEGGKFVTPEMPKISNPFPISANRNLTPMLETPLKFLDTPIKLGELPKTPGVFSPNTYVNTPMTKMLNEQLQGVDLLSIQTPKFPLTPSLPITPFDSKSTYPNRSTDYSTASSYYQPSDCEQNRSLEAILEECKKLANKNSSPEKHEKTESSVIVQNTISETISSFNQSQIAKKNLSLVRKDLEDSTSCESTSSDDENSTSSNNDTSSSNSTWNDSMNDTVVTSNSAKPENPYMLRSRKKTVTPNLKRPATIQDIVTNVNIKHELDETNVNIKHELDENIKIIAKQNILKEVEEKRKRTIAKFKEIEKPSNKKKGSPAPNTKTPIRDSRGKFKRKPKQRSKLAATITPKTLKQKISVNKNKRKSKSPIKLPQKTSVVKIEEENDVTFHISSDDDQIKPFDVVETELLESSSSSVGHPLNTFQKTLDSLKINFKVKESNENNSDQEAASLVEGLKKRGIYLVPNKTPRKQEKPVHNFSHINTFGNKPTNISKTDIFDKNKDFKENQTQTKLLEDTINQVVAVQNDPFNATDEKFKLHLATEKEIEPAEVKLDGDNIQAISLEEKKSNNKKSTPSTSLTELKPKENNNKSDAKLKSNQKNNSKDKKEHNKSANSKASLTVESKEENEVKTNSAVCNKDKPNKIDESNDAMDLSLEEGEILSDDPNDIMLEQSQSNHKKREQSQSKDKRHKSYTKTSSKSSSSESKRGNIKSRRSSKPESSDKGSQKHISSRDRITESRELKKEEATKSNSEKSNDPIKVPEFKPTHESQMVSAPSVQCSNVEHDLNLTDSFNGEVFDDKLFVEETLKLTYDTNKSSGKSLKDYDLPISNKCFVVEVLGQQMAMSVTPFETLLDIPERKFPEKVRILQNMILSPGKRNSSLNILYSQLMSPGSMQAISPLENLYSENSTIRNTYYKAQKLKRIEKRRSSMDLKMYECKPKALRDTRSKSVDCSSLKLFEEEQECVEIECKIVKDDNKSDNLECVEKENEPMKDANKTDSLDQVPEKSNQMPSVIDKSPCEETSPKEIDDDLMNYAICGSERVENDSDDKTRTNKRKAGDEAGETQLKKIKCQELLKNINVDVFLTQLHGDN